MKRVVEMRLSRWYKMSEVTEIEVSYSEKKQVEQFEPVEIGATATVALEDDDDVDNVFDAENEKLEEMVGRSLARRIMRQKRDKDED